MIDFDNQNHLPPFLNLHFKNQLWSLCLDTGYSPMVYYFNPLVWLKSPKLSSKYNSFIHFRHQQIPLTLVKSLLIDLFMCTQNKPTQLFYANTVTFQIIAFLHIYSIWIILWCPVALQATVVLGGLYKSILMNSQTVKKGENKKEKAQKSEKGLEEHCENKVRIFSHKLVALTGKWHLFFCPQEWTPWWPLPYILVSPLALRSSF